MIIGKPEKGDILIYTDYDKEKPIKPNKLIIYVGTVVEDSNTGLKKVGSGLPKELGVVISELVNETDSLRKELSELKYSYRKNMKLLVEIIDVLTSQTQLNNMNINDLKQNMEDITNEN